MGRDGRGRALTLTLALALGLPGGAPARGAQDAPATHGTELVGHLDPAPGQGAYGDVWAYRGVAYLGDYGGTRCARGGPPASVWAIDVRDPAHPKALAPFAAFPGSDGQDVWVGAVRTAAFSGDLAAVGIQPCDRGRRGFAGLALYDVTDPAHPRELGRLATGVESGVHELGVAARPDGRVLALESVPYSFFDSQGRAGDFRVVDVTDPGRPRQVADWDVRRDGPPALRAAAGARRDVLCHSAWPFRQGRAVALSFWAAGVLFLDLADPAHPRFLGQAPYRPGEQVRRAHSGWFNADETLFVQNDELLAPVGQGSAASWGVQHIYDTRNLARPALLSTFATEDAVAGSDGRVGDGGIFTVHNAVVEGTREYVSWYSDGVRVVDLADPRHPREIAWFVPPAEPDRTGVVSAPDGRRAFPMVWGVYPSDGVVLASDMASGLWLFRLRPEAAAGAPAGAAVAAGDRLPPGKAARGDSGPFAALLAGLAALGTAAVVAAVVVARRRRSG